MEVEDAEAEGNSSTHTSSSKTVSILLSDSQKPTKKLYKRIIKDSIPSVIEEMDFEQKILLKKMVMIFSTFLMVVSALRLEYILLIVRPGQLSVEMFNLGLICQLTFLLFLAAAAAAAALLINFAHGLKEIIESIIMKQMVTLYTVLGAMCAFSLLPLERISRAATIWFLVLSFVISTLLLLVSTLSLKEITMFNARPHKEDNFSMESEEDKFTSSDKQASKMKFLENTFYQPKPKEWEGIIQKAENLKKITMIKVRLHKEKKISMEPEEDKFTSSDKEASKMKFLENNFYQPKPEEWDGMIRKVENLTRKKDFLHLVLSYPMIPEPDKEVSFVFLRRKFSHMNQLRREIQALPSDNRYGEPRYELRQEMDSLILFARINLANHDFHMVAYLPQEDDINITRSDESLTHRIEAGLMSQTNGRFEAPGEMLELAIDSAIRQVSKCFEDGIFKKIGISGIGGKKVAKALKDIQMIRTKCSIVLCVSVSRHHSTREVRQNIAKQIAIFHQTDDTLVFEEQLLKFQPDNFLLLVDCVDGQIDLHDLKIPDHGFVVLTTSSQKVYEIMELDLEIRMEDHLLPWDLFCRNVGPSLVHSSSAIQQIAVRLVNKCHNHLLAIILLAKALKDVTDIGVWELALHQLTSQSYEVMVHVLKLVWDQKDIITKHCIKFCVQNSRRLGDSLVSYWISNSLVEKREGEAIFQDLIDSFILEKVGVDDVRMREETKNVLHEYFIPYLPSFYLRQGGLGLAETPKIEEWNNAREIYLMNNKLFELPENPKCPILKKLLLHKNYELMKIPQLFFKDMPLLHTLDLSYTNIKSLPPSVSMLVSLRTFYLKGCELLTELPPQVGELGKLEVFDLEGTEILYLPKEIGLLISLKCFRVSFCGCANRYEEFKQMDLIIPTKVLSKLSELNELSIDVNPEADWEDVVVWDANVKEILSELSSLQELKILRLCLPSVELLQQLRWNNKKVMYPDLSQFRFTVGCHTQRIIFRLPHEVGKLFKKWGKSKKCLKYINGEGKPSGITEALHHASVFFLDRHYTLKTLSEFGNENMVQLQFCLLVECNELQTIIDGDNEYQWGVDNKPVFGWLQYLGIHYMKNLQSIWKGQIDKGCLSNLKYLALHTCPNLITIFTLDLLGNLAKLEELIVEDCFKIKSLVSWESSDFKSGYVLQSLKKMSLLDLPELVSISGGLSIGPVLESMTVYNCPKLENLHAMEVSSDKLKIKGEKEWWDSLKWHESEWRNNTRPAYEELESDEDLMGPSTKDIYSH